MLSKVAVSNNILSTRVESSDHNTVVETDVDGSHDSNNVSNYATISDTVQELFLWLGWFDGKVSLVEKTKSGKVFTIKYEDNTSEHLSIEYFKTTVPNPTLQLGDLYFVPYKNFEDPRDTLLQQWLKLLIATSEFVNYVMERVIITH